MSFLADALNRAVRHHREGRLGEAECLYRQVLRVQPHQPDALHLLGLVALQSGDAPAAVALIGKALERRPHDPRLHYHHGNALAAQERFADAAAAFRKAIAGAPEFAEAHCNLARIAIEGGRLAEGIAHCERAIALKPDLAEAHNNLALARQTRAEIGAAIAGFAHARSLRADYAAAESNLLVALNYDPAQSAATIRDAHRRWGERMAARARPLPRAANVPDPNRRLRVGYVSADFRRHPVGYFLAGVLANHDRDRIETYCYSGTLGGDELTAELRASAAHWREAAGVSDDALARRIRADAVDILVDLSGHTAGNRLAVFARKPAPLQITWAGYVGTTGLAAIDYLVADRFHVPEANDPLYVERVVRLPHGYVCYAPPAYAPPVGALPALAGGVVTFGSFNFPGKLNNDVLATWAKILAAVPASRLILKYRGLDDPTIAAWIAAAFTRSGVDAARVVIEGPSLHADLLARYNGIDIALDPFPYSGGLTTLEALWMGVPVVTWPAERFASRHSLSHLSNVGLSDMVATSREAYVRLATALADDLPRLARLRAGLRGRMARSPLCDGPGFTRALEKALRAIWRAWCAAQRR